MAWTVLDETTSGAPSLLAVNGSLTSLLRWALPLLGWAVEYGPTGNDAVFRAATGNRHRLQCRHNSSLTSSDASMAMVRAAHTATNASTIASPFPTTAQVANASCTWRAGIEGNSTDPCRFVIAGNETFFHYFCYSPSYGWDWNFFGDVPSDYATGYETVINTRNNTAPYGSNALGETMYGRPQSANQTFWARGINATTVSTKGCKDGKDTPPGRVTGTPAMRGGYQNRLLREKIGLHCTGSTNDTPGVLAIPKRGWLPNVWNPIHNGLGGLADGDTFTDSAYNPAASFRVLDSPPYGTIILETTDTWTKP